MSETFRQCWNGMCRGVETASHAGHCPINLVNV